MNKLLSAFLLISFFAVITACGNKEESENQMPNMNDQNIMRTNVHNVLVEEKIDASTYSYLKVNENNNSYWIAVNKMDINPGEYLMFSQAMEMQNFKSESLNKTFDKILFVDDARKSESNTDLKSPHQNIAAGKDESINISKLKDGYTVEQIYQKKDELEFKIVKVKGKVVKVNENIMGTNWIHIQDGTGSNGTHDLLLTSNQSVKAGSTIIAEGKVIKDKDFGSGYYYNVLLENSKITVE
ncbi:MAG: hypothetical protein ROY99_09965 [Ignavibacterium sp.]|nr:hypothetical protein [Ignavibacterium sp.]